MGYFRLKSVISAFARGVGIAIGFRSWAASSPDALVAPSSAPAAALVPMKSRLVSFMSDKLRRSEVDYKSWLDAVILIRPKLNREGYRDY